MTENKNNNIEQGTIQWKSPSNIALVKYWGKRNIQLPANPSLSMSLSQCVTNLTLKYKRSNDEQGILKSFRFNGMPAPDFEKKIRSFIANNIPELPYLSNYNFEINSFNTFPHSSGIASSASSMSALVLALLSLQAEIHGEDILSLEWLKKASHYARLASGSASRSVYGGYVVWGENVMVKGSSDLFAMPLTNVHPIFENWGDAILVLHAGVKNLSSSEGHKLMDSNPYREVRFAEATNNMEIITEAIRGGDVDTFIEIVEHEALTLHALMMTSKPGYTELKPESLIAIQKIRNFRNDTGISMAFTLDAGPNIHLLYDMNFRNQVISFVEQELAYLCQKRLWIDDKIGEGPVKLS